MRRELLLSQLAELEPDVIGLQELRHFPDQGRWIASALGARTARAHWIHAAYKTGLLWLWEGIAILTRLPILERGTFPLAGQHRVACFVRVSLPGGGALDVFNTHLASVGADLRVRQATRLLGWMQARVGAPQVLVGDFNADPRSEAVQLLSRSLRSAYAVAHGAEPASTVRTGAVLDYVFVGPGVEVVDARVTFGATAAGDPRVSASDHLGVVADIWLNR